MTTVQEVVTKYGSLADLLTFTETPKYIVIKTRKFLGADNFAKIAAVTRNAGGEYISAGKESHFRVPNTSETTQPSQFVPSDPLAVTKHIDDIIQRLEALKKEVDAMLKKP